MSQITSPQSLVHHVCLNYSHSILCWITFNTTAIIARMKIETPHIENIKQLIKECGDSPCRQGMQDTPKRFLHAMKSLTQGYHQNLDDIINGALFDSDMDQMVVVKGIEFYSLCEHHLLPFSGHCHIGYIPNGKVLGLSKLARIVDMFARRFQIQESLTQQIAQCIANVTLAKGVGVIIESQHLCMQMRGVQKQGSVMTTSVMLGLMRDQDKTRAEFMHLIR